jgi:hypothetical protein
MLRRTAAIRVHREEQLVDEGLPLDLESRITRLVGRPAQVVVLNKAPAELIHIVEHRLGDLTTFATAIRARLG